MEGIGKDAVQLLQYLLPGFLAAWVYYGLTPYKVPSQFERVVQALIFTLIIQAAVYLERVGLERLGRPWKLSISDEPSHLLASAISALVIGCIFSLCANHDLFHALARKLRITTETSYPSQWYSAFCSDVTYVVLQLTDDRRIYGWPREWPSDPAQGHFVLEQPSWLTEDGRNEEITGVSDILIAVSDVRWVEFMSQTWKHKP